MMNRTPLEWLAMIQYQFITDTLFYSFLLDLIYDHLDMQKICQNKLALIKLKLNKKHYIRFNWFTLLQIDKHIEINL